MDVKLREAISDEAVIHQKQKQKAGEDPFLLHLLNLAIHHKWRKK